MTSNQLKRAVTALRVVYDSRRLTPLPAGTIDVPMKKVRQVYSRFQ